MKHIKLLEQFIEESKSKKFSDAFAVLDFFGGALPNDYSKALTAARKAGYDLPTSLYDEAAMLAQDGVNENKSDYQVYHNMYSSAINAALEYAEKQGYTYDKEEVAVTIGMGNRKPSDGITNKFTITLYKDGKEQKKALQIQVYGMGNKYELNTYVA